MNLKLDLHPPIEKCRCVIRLRTSIWSDKNGFHVKRSLTYLRRKCMGHNLLENDIEYVGAEEMSLKMNLNKYEDGIYEVKTCNIRRDWETGMIDDYDYALVPIDEKEARDEQLRQTCSPEHPMPKDATGRWEHTNVEEIKCEDGHPGGDVVTLRCKDCGKIWRSESPQ